MTTRMSWLLGCILLALSTTLVAQDSLDQAVTRPVTWKKLTYVAPIFLSFSATASIQLREVDLADISARLESPKDLDVLEPSTDKLLEMTMVSDNFGRRSDVSLWFEPDLRVIQRKQLDSGKRNRLKIYRFLNAGIWSYLKEPAAAEIGLDVNQWTRESVKVFKSPASFGGQTIVDNSILFYLVSRYPFAKNGDSFAIHSFYKGHIHRLILRREAREEIEPDYIVRRNNDSRTVWGETPVHRISLRSIPVTAPEGTEYELLGLKGMLYLYIEPDSGVIVQLSGDVDYLGQVDIYLKQVEY